MFANFCRSGRVPAAGLVVLLGAGSVRADQLDRAMVADAAAITQAVCDLKAKNVAALKFQVKLGKADPSFAVGTAGTDMLHRVENLLILCRDPEKDGYTVLTGGGEAATKLGRDSKTAALWSREKGCDPRLFDLELPVIWDGTKSERPDAFITGTVFVHENLQEVTVELIAFTRDAPAAPKVLRTLTGPTVNGTTHGIWMDRAMLAGLGRSFSTDPNLKPADKAIDLYSPDQSAVSDVRSRSLGGKGHPPRVELEIYLDGRKIDLEPDRPGELKLVDQIPPGSEGRKVEFRLTNHHPAKLAVLLCVDGNNLITTGTLKKLGDGPPARFRMFVLEPKKTYSIRSYYDGEKDGKGRFRDIEIASRWESDELYAQLDPAFRGRIQMFVYGRAMFDVPSIMGGKADGTQPVQIDPAANVLDQFDEGRKSAPFVGDPNVKDAGSAADALNRVSAKTELKPRGRSLAYNPGPPTQRSLMRPAADTRVGNPLEYDQFDYDEMPLESLVVTYYVK